MTRMIRERDWSATPLGPIGQWPAGLRFCLNLMLPSRSQLLLFWGSELLAFYNDAYAPTIGTKHPTALGRPAREGWAELWDDLGPLLHAALDRGETISAKDRPFQINRAGYLEDVFFDISYSPVRGAEGEIEGVLCVVNETTERVKAERALAESEARLRATAERIELALDAGAVVGTWVWDVPNDIVTGDERLARTFGLPDTVLDEGMPIGEVTQAIHPEDATRVGGQISEALARGGAFRAEYRVHDAEGQWRWVEAAGKVELDEQGRATRFPGVLINIQAHKEAEAALAELNETLELRVVERTRDLEEAQARLHQSQKMEAVGQLTGGISHDFNNLLMAISGSLQLMQARIAQGRTGEIDRYAGAAQAAVKRAASLTHRLLAFSRRQTLDPKPVDVNRLIGGMEELIRRTVGPAIELEVVGAGGLWPTLVDAHQLENALLNLCINARDAMPDGGRITMETANKWLDQRAARERDLPIGQYLSVCVTDTGTGMTPEVMARAFEPFFTTKPLGMGTGLGLSMIYGFVRQSGGQVRIYSELGQGTTMCLYLPRYAGDAPTGDALSLPPTAAPVHDGETVLVVDDEPTVRMLVAEVLGESGFKVIEAEDGRGGLKVLESPARIDLLVTDVGLPGGMNGRQLADAAKALRPGLKVLFITGYAENAVVGNGHLEPGVAVLTKPFDIESLGAKIREMMAGEAP